MKDLLYCISQAGPASQVLLQSGAQSVTRTELLLRAEGLARRLRNLNVHSIALYADNGIDWILVDLACQAAGIRIVPVPLFFSAAQIKHTISSSGTDALLTDQDVVAELLDSTETLRSENQPFMGSLNLYLLEASQSALLPYGTQKITFTSGTTGAPKGVCLSADQQSTVATSIASTIDVDAPKHLCVLPLSTLLENLAGVYAPLLAGGTIIVPPLADVGLTGSSELDIQKLLTCIVQHQPDSLILVPEILNALVVSTECGWRPPSSLHFVAVGGGKVAPELLRRARLAGLPAFEGYGLSECASVVTLNVPGADHPGSVGRPLPHVHIHIDDGEIVVTGGTFLGYADRPDTWEAGPVHTGDIGHVDEKGFVHVDGRKKNLLITSYGRNVSPEWIECELTAGPLLQQAVVFGDARPFCVALLHPHDASTTDEEIAAWIRSTNQRLPDYARIVDWRRLSERLTGQTPNRSVLQQMFGPLIDQMYERKPEASNQ